MGKNSKGQKPAKGSKDAFSLVKIADNVHQQQQFAESGDTGDVIAGFDFLKSFVSDDAMGDSPIAASLRKMAKKDSMTKIKALQDFIDLVNSFEGDMGPYLQFWSRCYCRLTMCGDHRVRELSQTALSLVISKAGRQFANCLKIVIPYCVLSHADCVASVASAAKLCLELSFNESRRVQAISMCKMPIFELIASIIKFTNPYLADKTLGLDEEEVLRRDRLLSACLGGWAMVSLNQQLALESVAAAASSTDSEEAVTNIIADILTSPDFGNNVLKSNSQLTLSALHVWIVTMCQYSPDVVTTHSKLFLSTVFLVPQSEGEMASSRIVDVGSWQSAAALSRVTCDNSYWKQPQFEKQLLKRLSSLLANGPTYFVTPPTPFFAIANVPTLVPISEAVIALLHGYLATTNSESALKFVRRFVENAQQGFQKMKPFHARHKELIVFCDTVFGSLLVFMDKTDFGQEIASSCFEAGLKMFSNVLKLDQVCNAAIIPNFAKFFVKTNHDSPHFQTMFDEAILRHIQLLVTGPESQCESSNFADFFNLFSSDQETTSPFFADRKLLSLLAKVVCSALGSMRALGSIGNVFNFLCSLSPRIISSCAIEESSREQLRSEVNLLVEEIVTSDDKWQENDREIIITKLLLHWEFLVSAEESLSCLKKLCQNVKSLSELFGLIPRLASKFRSNEHIISLCGQLLSSSDFFTSPREVTNLLFTILDASEEETKSSEMIRKTIVTLLQQVAEQMFNCESNYYVGKIVQENESHTKYISNPTEILLTWLDKQEDLRAKSSAPQTIACFAEILRKIGDPETFSDETIENCLVIQVVANCYSPCESFTRDLLKKCSYTVKSSRFLAVLRDVAFYSRETFCLLVLGVAEIGANIYEELAICRKSVEDLPIFRPLIDNWLLSHCFTNSSATFENTTAKSDDFSVDLHLKNLIFASSALLFASRMLGEDIDVFASKNICELIIEAVSTVEFVSPSSWLSVQLLEFVDELLLSEKYEKLLTAFVRYCRSVSKSLKPKLAFTYLLSGRHTSSSLDRVIHTITLALASKFDQQFSEDLWLLSATISRILRSERKMPAKLVELLNLSTGEVLNGLLANCTNADLIQQKLRLFSQLTSSLANTFCDEIRLFDEDAIKSILKALISPALEGTFLRDNAAVSLEDDGLFNRLNATADLAIFYNCCLRYTQKLANVDPILCSVCSWISTAKNVMNAVVRLQGRVLNSREKCELTRFLVATTECAHTFHKLFSSSSKKIAFSPSEKQRNEFVEFYQLQYLDSLIQLLMSLWLPISADSHQSFLSFVLKNRSVQDQLTYAIVSCLHKASSIDVIAHVHLEPLFCADESYLPEDVQTIIGRLSPLITDATVDDVRVHLAIYTVLSTLSPTLSGIYLSLSGDISQQRDNDDDFVLTPPRVWLREISELTEAVSIAVTLDNWRNHPERVSSYLYVWLLVLRLAGSLPSEVRPPMVNFLRKSPDFQALLLNVFALAPANPLLVDPAPFDSLPQLDNTSEAVPLVGHLACYMIRELLATFPAVVRSWLNDQVPSLRRDIIGYVSQHISPTLRAVELSKVRQAEFGEEIKIRVMTATGELVATYQSDQVRLDLTISLPDDYPLSVPVIECKQNVLNSISKLWLRQLTALLICQNGAVLDALMLWQKLITEKLGKLEECTICYSIVQGGNLNLPKRQCKQCKKRFHSSCLFKWFETSGNVTCPLCREQFY